MKGQVVGKHANTRILPQKHLGKFLDVLREFGELYAPVEKAAGQYAFQLLTNNDDLVVNYARTILPPKKFLYPPKQVMYEFNQKGFVAPPPEQGKKILFGVHPCDINSFEILDMVLYGKYIDPRYHSRRQNTVIIGLSCMPDENCFCHSMGTGFVDKGFDLFLTDLGDTFFVRIGSSLGEDMVRAGNGLFEEIREDSVKQYKERANQRNRMFRHDVAMADLAQILQLEYDSPVWEELGKKCLSCGSCSIVCPTCYCYDISDQLNLDVQSGVRTQRWDSCLLRDFALVAGGHNFREERSTRMKLHFYHKHFTFIPPSLVSPVPEEFGRSTCVGCGRCIDACPAGISIIDTIKKIRGEKVMENVG